MADASFSAVRLVNLLLAALLCGLGVYTSASATDNVAVITNVQPVVRNSQLYLDTDINLEIKNELRNVAMKGVPIYFTANVDIRTKRWWWFDKQVVQEQLTWRIMYNALTRQWRVSNGELSLPETTLDDALDRVRHIRGWSVANVAQLASNNEYQGRIRLRLDTSLLARPFQIDALNSSAWSLSTPWKNFSFSISESVDQQ